MLRLLPALLLAFAVSTPVVTSTRWRPTVDDMAQIQLSTPEVTDIADVTVYDLDLFDTDDATIDRLHAEGIRVVCYFSAGTWEDWRPDAPDFPDEVVGDSWDEWPGEAYLDIRQIDVLAPIFRARLDLCVEKGFDGVDLDNIDAYGGPTGFPLTEADAEAWARWLADEAHARGLAIGQKNTPDLTARLVDTFDFAVTEDCAADGWCDGMRPYLEQGKPVFAIEYTDVTSENAFRGMCADPANEGLSFVFKDRDLGEPIWFCPALD